jgi:uncharacterized protein (DUF885 family)
LVVALASAAAAAPAGPGPADAAARLSAIIEEDWRFRLEEDPLLATQVGERTGNDRLPADGLDDHARRRGHDERMLERLEALDPAALDVAGRTNHEILKRLVSERIAEHRFGAHLMPITNRSGFHVEFAELPTQVPLADVRDYEDYVARLAAFRRWVADHVELMRRGIAERRTLPAVVLEGWETAVEAHVVDEPRASRLWAPFADLPPTLDVADRERLSALGAAAIRESVVPGYRDFARFMREEYLPAARASIAASALPDGGPFYAHRVRRFTTLALDAETVHETGLGEVRRLREEMRQIIERLGFEGSFEAFLEFLRSDPRFYATTPDELLRDVAFVLKRMDGELPRLFGRLPRAPYGIREVPGYIAPKTTTAYYERPAGDGSRAGFYFVNTHDLASRPLYEVEALSLHEAVPGHHLQIALQQELENLPAFRRFNGFTAFVEGWALYAERLGLEVGFYQDPYSDFGRLTYEMWRACRLVVDTGIHAFGWSRERAIAFMVENSALARHNVETEVDRYIAWPGQALAYKVGELKIRELRERAERRLGSDFDLRRFHDVVLGEGAVPLTVLERNVASWIESEARR